VNVFSPKVLLHIEGFVVLVVACALYAHFQFSWITFAILFFAPDLAMLGYAINKKTGTICYNLFHTYTVPLVIFLALFCQGSRNYEIPLIWTAHIAFDRLLGYGIKYETAFKDTHLQKV
jgi:hypothetical protein